MRPDRAERAGEKGGFLLYPGEKSDIIKRFPAPPDKQERTALSARLPSPEPGAGAGRPNGMWGAANRRRTVRGPLSYPDAMPCGLTDGTFWSSFWRMWAVILRAMGLRRAAEWSVCCIFTVILRQMGP